MSDIFTVHHGKVYRAHLKLSWFESFASEDMVAEKFKVLGFTNVTITGTGEDRYAIGTWNGPDESVPLTDEHIVTVQEVHAPHTAMVASHNPSIPEYPDGLPLVFGDFKDEKEKEDWDKLHEDGG